MKQQSMWTTPVGRAIWLPLLTLTLGCSGTPERAETSYTTVAEQPDRDSRSAKKLNSEAVRLIEQQDYAEAEEKLKSALAADITCGPAHNNLGKVYYHRKKLYLAAWEFEYAAKLMPHHPEPRNNLGLIFEAVGRLDEAEESYGAALLIAPDNPQVLGNLARTKYRRGERSAELRRLLSDVALKDTRPEWSSWAQDKLRTLPKETDKKDDRP